MNMKWLFIMLISMLPVSELRGAIPLALGVYKMSPVEAFFWAILGNIIPVIFILWLLDPFSRFLMKHSEFCNNFFVWLFKRTRSRHSRKFKKWKSLALIVLVAIPLPMTGAWTGSIAAFIFGISYFKALGLIFLGVVIAGLIVTLASMGTLNILRV